ncbi:hypothetical protein [Vallitalea guaymasensis]|uniref:hypothetical protein n=1 Tax=Vallitalea guaymasensis TaxID=1185412 RepID=UPI000DE56F33|nr:hypothetical protein [Vallitalea guaymasensis]
MKIKTIVFSFMIVMTMVLTSITSLASDKYDKGDTLYSNYYPLPGSELKVGYYLKSNNDKYTLFMQHDGNLVLYDEKHEPLWATNTNGYGGVNHIIVFQFYGGGLALKDLMHDPHSDFHKIWERKFQKKSVWKPHRRLVLQDDGNLVVYDKNNKAIWATGTNR